MLLSLSDELLVRVLSCCDPSTLPQVAQCCRRLHSITEQDWLWEAVLVKTCGAAPMSRLANTWRAELLKRRRLVSQWTGLDRSIVSSNIPNDLGTVIRSFVVDDGAVVVIVGEAGLLRYDVKLRKRTLFYYSTRFSESAVLSACAVTVKQQLVFGFSDGSVVVIDRIPDDANLGWDQCNWCTMVRSGPCVIDLQVSKSNKFVAIIAQRRQSETAALISVYNVKTRGRIFNEIVNDYSSCRLCEDGTITLPVVVDCVNVLPNGFIVTKDKIVHDDQQFDIPHDGVFTSQSGNSIVFLVSPNELILFSPQAFMMTARMKIKPITEIEDVLVKDEVIIVTGRNGVLVIMEAVGGAVIAKRSFKAKPATQKTRVVWAERGVIVAVNGNELMIVTIKAKPQTQPPTSKSPKAALQKKLQDRLNQQHIVEGRSELSEEKHMATVMDDKRHKMNIEGLTEEEMIQLAQILSLDTI